MNPVFERLLAQAAINASELRPRNRGQYLVEVGVERIGRALEKGVEGRSRPRLR